MIHYNRSSEHHDVTNLITFKWKKLCTSVCKNRLVAVDVHMSSHDRITGYLVILVTLSVEWQAVEHNYWDAYWEILMKQIWEKNYATATEIGSRLGKWWNQSAHREVVSKSCSQLSRRIDLQSYRFHLCCSKDIGIFNLFLIHICSWYKAYSSKKWDI